MSHFDYEQFLRQRGLAAPKREAKAASLPRKDSPAAHPTSSRSDSLDDEFFNYELPACNWTPGGNEAFCGEGVICPPCG